MTLKSCCVTQPFSCTVSLYFFFFCVKRESGPQASPGAPEGRGLRGRPVELWKLHLPQPPCPQPLWTVRDAAVHLSLALRCSARPCPIPTNPWIVWAPPLKKLQNLSRGLPLSINMYAEGEPLTLSAHLSCAYLLLLCTLTPFFSIGGGWFLFRTVGDSFHGKCVCVKEEGTHCDSGQLVVRGFRQVEAIEEEELRFTWRTFHAERVTALFTLRPFRNSKWRHFHFNLGPVTPTLTVEQRQQW